MIIKKFIEWNNSNNQLFNEKSINIEINERTDGTEIDSIWVLHRSQIHYGQVTVWERGMFEIEIIEISTGDTALYMSCRVNDSKNNIDINDLLVLYKEILINN